MYIYIKAKLTSTLHLLIPRLRLLQKKSTASSVVQRRELAQLLETQRDASARIRVENVIATDIAVEVMEMVELYCELLLARAGVLDGLAFGEKGKEVRTRVRDEVPRSQSQSHGQEREMGKGKAGSRGFFGIFGGSKASTTNTPTAAATVAGLTAGTTVRGAEGKGNNSTEPSGPGPETETEPTGGEGEGGGEGYYLDPAIDEASVAIFYAWSRFPTEVRELTLLRTLLAERYGKDFMALAAENKLAGVKVPERLVKGLQVRPPSAELVESYLREIARAYKVPWAGLEDEGDSGGIGEGVPVEGDVGLDLDLSLGGGDGDGDGPGQEGMERRTSLSEAELKRATPPRGPHAHQLSGKSPVSVAPPGPRSDNPNPRVKVPGPDGKDRSGSTEVASPVQRGKDKNGIPEVDELTRRFAALKR
ncbi:regulator of Vps4 activity in the MVB pathway-domain-containing protein [Aspergillus egyptiacus]|nr:regulator of Vps4 activity in the MVB pathway-domain-containing protein [Aspergillus egyptiacus]